MLKECLLERTKGSYACSVCPLRDCFLSKCGRMSKAERVLIEIKLHEIKDMVWNPIRMVWVKVI